MNANTHMEDAQGRLVPIENVKERDLLCDQLVRGIIPEFKAEQKQMLTLKEKTYNDIAAFISLSLERYGVKVGGEKGNVTLMSYDGKYKIVRSMQDHLTFDEGLLAAQALIGECLTEWTAGSRPELRSIVERAFKQDKQGNISTSAVLELRRLDIADDRWQRAMQAIAESLQVVLSKSYIRVFERNTKGGWDNITLDFAKL